MNRSSSSGCPGRQHSHRNLIFPKFVQLWEAVTFFSVNGFFFRDMDLKVLSPIRSFLRFLWLSDTAGCISRPQTRRRSSGFSSSGAFTIPLIGKPTKIMKIATSQTLNRWISELRERFLIIFGAKWSSMSLLHACRKSWLSDGSEKLGAPQKNIRE